VTRRSPPTHARPFPLDGPISADAHSSEFHGSLLSLIAGSFEVRCPFPMVRIRDSRPCGFSDAAPFFVPSPRRDGGSDPAQKTTLNTPFVTTFVSCVIPLASVNENLPLADVDVTVDRVIVPLAPLQRNGVVVSDSDTQV